VTAAVPTRANDRGRGLDWWGQLVSEKRSRAVAAEVSEGLSSQLPKES
jgi:hypothetical protein